MLACTLLALATVGVHAAPFGFDDVARRASELASRPYSVPQAVTPKALNDLNYDQYRDIRFRPDKALWKGSSPFELQFFHPGSFYNHPVRISEIVAGVAREIRFDPELFDYGKNAIDPKVVRGLGFTGLRVHFPLNNPKYKDEVLVFQGASYFRALGKDQRYGLSARGLAVDTALASGEEFPRFVEFWINRPAPSDRELVIYALLDSRSVTGAYRFVLRPGAPTRMDVRARLYLRQKVMKLGIAPLTSMYLHGENQPPAAGTP